MATAGCYSGVAGGAGGATESGEDDGAPTEGDTEASADDGSGDGPGSDELPECDPTLVAPEVALRRLTKLQYQNTVADLVAWAVGDAAPEIVASLDTRFAAFPDDVRQQPEGEHLGGFRRMDQAVQQQHVDAGYQVAVVVANALSGAHLSTIAGDCAVDGDPGNDDACVDDFVLRFGTRALRRPLSDAEADYYRAAFDADGMTEGTPPEAFADVITAMMISPQFMYLIEHGTDPVEELDNVYALSGYELASRLSYHFWLSAPDDELLDAAASGELDTDDGYAQQVDRMLAHPRARAALAEFYREWLWLDDVPAVGSLADQDVFAEFVGNAPIDDATRDNVIEETVDMALHYTFDTPGTLQDLMLSTASFASTADVAALYGTPVWDGGEPPQFPDDARVGLLTRASRLVNASPSTRPIIKGVFVRLALLCDTLPPPPPNAQVDTGDFDPSMTTRQRIEALTEAPGSTCVGCHATQINPLGFATEQFDALGRFRTEERIFDQDGAQTSVRPVDATVVPRVEGTDETVVENPRQLSELILDSGKVQACFARHYLRFTYGREEDVDADACALRELTDQLDEDASLLEVLREIAVSPSFRQRSFD